jgi:DNA-binding response OmpR family regulator
MGITDIFKKKGGAGRMDIKVLVVEDENYLREVCLQKLRKEGFDAAEAVDGEMALHEVIKVKPDIVLLDIILPYMNGFEVLQKIRQSPNRDVAKVPVIMMSNLGDDEDIQKAKELGANDYLIKANFTVDQIINKVKTTLIKTGRIKE